MERLEQKVALITGAGSGIGASSALRMASEGAAVMCADLNGDGARDTAAKIGELGGRGAALELDVTSEAAVQDALAQTATELGGLDIVMNNAGIDDLARLFADELAKAGLKLSQEAGRIPAAEG